MTEAANQLTPTRERISLFEHGTKAFEMPPGAIYHAAVTDIEHKTYNAGVYRQRATLRADGHRKLASQIGPILKYAFLTRHVKEAETARDLLRLAVADREEGLADKGNMGRLHIYSDEGRLSEALKIAEAVA